MTDYYDVVIVGAGIAGISAAWHVRNRCPDLTFTILESRGEVGGTWSIHNYPGVRCDSDMFTLGFRFHPWTESRSIADGSSILQYLRDATASAGVAEHIQFDRQVRSADWSSEAARWRLVVQAGEREVGVSCRFLIMCTGYYRYDAGYAPRIPGMERFAGAVVHPQCWPDSLDLRGKTVAIVGSGATAVTLAPALAEEADHVVMIQRSPSYIISRPEFDSLAAVLLKLLPTPLAVSILRFKNIALMTFGLYLAGKAPGFLRRVLLGRVGRQLPPRYPLVPDFSPRYDPWKNRLCLALNGDFFNSIVTGKLSIVTDTIANVGRDEVVLTSGASLPAQVIITATGFNMQLFGGIRLTRDGRAVALRDCVAYKGMMLTGLPNLFFTVGYQAASYTLKADLASEFAVRVLRHMSTGGYDSVEPVLDDDSIRLVPFTEYRPGYIERVLDTLPKQGSRPPWCLTLNYFRDLALVRYDRLDDNGLVFAKNDAETVPAGESFSGDQRPT
jgi:monooxygenase